VKTRPHNASASTDRAMILPYTRAYREATLFSS